VNVLKPNEIANKLSTLFRDRLNIIRACKSTVKAETSEMSVLCDQILDSIIVGEITGVSAYIYGGGDVSLKAAILSFLLTFLIKMKEYRKIG
jgi:hypothetical protein